MAKFGMYRAIVICNNDPQKMGRVRVFVPGVYPEEYKSTPAKLPWAEPAMSIFGGNFTAPDDSENEETGVCTTPHAGKNGDGAQVWVFFEAGDIRYPVYFAVSQAGKGWLSKHPNQHVMATDNVKIIVDEYDNMISNANDKSQQVSDETAANSWLGAEGTEGLNNSLNAMGGIDGLASALDSMNGTSGMSSFLDSAGGVDGLKNLADSMGGSLSPLSSVISSAGGFDKFNQMVSSAGGFNALMKAANGEEGASSAAISAIENTYGSCDKFMAELDTIGGANGLSSCVSSLGGYDSFASSISGIGGLNGINSMNQMMNDLGGPSGFKSFMDNLKSGVDSLDQLVVDHEAEQEQKAQAIKTAKEVVTKCDTYTDRGSSSIRAAGREGMKTRLSVNIQANKDCAIDLNITGQVNMRIEGNVYREIIGNIYDTHIGEHHIYHKGGTHLIQKGSTRHDISNRYHLDIKSNKFERVGGNRRTVVDGYNHITCDVDKKECRNRSLSVAGNTLESYGPMKVSVMGPHNLAVTGSYIVQTNNFNMTAAKDMVLNALNAEIYGNAELLIYANTLLNLKSNAAMTTNVTGAITIISQGAITTTAMEISDTASTVMTRACPVSIVDTSPLVNVLSATVNITGNTDVIGSLTENGQQVMLVG